MQKLTGTVLEKSDTGVFTLMELARWVGGSSNRRFALLKRALKSGEVIRIHRGLYYLGSKYLRQKPDPLVLAQRIYGPSYISLETALSYHGWIPEAVYAITSASVDRSREIDTPIGHFSFTRIPQKVFYTEVTRIEKEGSKNEQGFHISESFLMASPLKALADYVYAHRLDWISANPVIESLRVDESSLSCVETEIFDRLLANYSSRRVRRFLRGLRKDLNR
ncbi:MAG: hypothetical protein QUT30_19315 [Acidobacteriota bacterium]|nr:hypothetical protein [Acidobacteriota bacterium]